MLACFYRLAHCGRSSLQPFVFFLWYGRLVVVSPAMARDAGEYAVEKGSREGEGGTTLR